MNADTENHPSPGERLRHAWHAARLGIIFLVGLIGASVVLILPQSQAEFTFVLAEGDVAPQDILAPYALTYTSEVLTERSRATAAAAVAEVYDPPDSGVARDQLELLRSSLDFIDVVRSDPIATQEEKLSDLAALENLPLSPESALAILSLPDPRWEAIKVEVTSVLEQVMRNEIREGRLEEARRTVPAIVSISFTEDQAALVGELVTAFIAPNAMLNQAATDAARENARAAVAPIQKTYAPGETIVSRGELITSLELEALQTYGLLKPPDPWQRIAIRTLLVVTLASALTLYATRLHGEQVREVRMASTLSVMFIALVAAMQFMIPNRTVLPYLFPAATLPILLAILYSPGMGVMTAMVSGALAGYLAPRGLELGLYVALSGTFAALIIGRAERISTFFWAGFAASLSAALLVIIFRFPDPATDLLGKATLLGAALICGMLSSSLAFGLLLLVGSILGITTSLQLIELSRPDHPLLQMLLQNAPGTYQHSLQVANLAEQAARAIGANPLLTRVGALYHDVGKTVRPQFFIENQVPGQNVHEQLDPHTSAGVILAHVREGLDLARKYRLPPRIQDFIREHHGTLETSYQYHAALEAVDGDESQLDRADFTYPGPKPRSQETALLMLADGVEAKARADMPLNETDIDSCARWVIDDRLSAGQLDRTDLTLKDLDTIRRSFVKTLKNVYHPRLRYPGTSSNAQAGSPAPASEDPSKTPA
jgi:putative nucleotidyltransferase with HDIG domain